MGNYKNNPWLGLESYQENQIIYGRDKEIEELSQCVLNNKETVFYGKSGIGKSSIINAGIIPVVRKHGYVPIVVRLDHGNKHSYIKQLSDLIEKGTYVSECTIAKPVEEQLLWEYFHTHRFNNTEEERPKLVIIFDQFEEIFTIQNNAAKKGQFFKELGDVLNNVMPKELTEDCSIKTTDLQSRATKQESVSGFADMAKLFSTLAASVNNSSSKYIDDNDIHVVFTLREDFLSEFEYHTSKIPSLKQHRYCLRPLNEEQAAEIILKPRPELVDEEVARIIIETVTNRTDFSIGNNEPEIDVDAAILSLFLNQIFDKRVTEDSPITIDLIKTFGKDIIKNFYEESIRGLSPEQIDFLEKELLTGENRRDSLSKSDFKAGGFTDAELKRLIDDRKLLRQFHYEGDLRVEFIHDTLCPVVKEHREQLENQKKLKEIQKEQERLMEEAEQQRREKNREYNRIKLLNSLNVLTVKGRSLIDNALDFGELRTLTNSRGKSPIDKLLNVGYAFDYVTSSFFNINVAEDNSQQVFYDSHLIDTTTFLSFSNNGEKIATSDGIYKVELKYSNKKIVEILFYGKASLNGVDNYDSHIYIAGGYAGIFIKYDESGREIQRTFVDEKKKPIACKDGYSVITREYDEMGNPNKTRYYNYEAERLVPCLHSDGNHGFDSVFDECGNEVYRLFVDIKNSPTTIVSGVYGKGMSYDSQSFLRTSLCNIDSQKNIMQDKDGYAVEKYRYNDDNHLLSKELYYDKTGKPWTNHDGCHGTLFKIDYDANILRLYNLGVDGQIIEDCHGVSSYECELNPTHKITAVRNYSLSGNLADNDGISEYHLDYDNCGRVNSFEEFSEQHIFKLGYSFEFNKEGTSILRLWNIGVDGEPVIDEDYGDDDHPVYGQEYDRSSSGNYSLSYFLNNENKYITCNDGYYAVAKWFDENGDLQKELFFDKDNNPMPDKDGVFGHLIERVNESETKYINIASDGSMIEDKDGVCIKLVKQAGESTFWTFFNEDNVQIPSNDIWRTEIITRKENKQTIVCTRGYDKDNNLVNGTYQEDIKDSKQRLILQTTKDCTGQPVLNEDGYCSIKIDYSDDGLTRKTMCVDKEGNMVAFTNGACYETEELDSYGRTICDSLHDIDGNLLPMSLGQYRTRYEYRRKNDFGVKTTSYLGQDGKLVNVKISEDEVAAIVEQRFDEKGRLVGLKCLNSDNQLRKGFQVIKEYILCSKDGCAYKLYALDEAGASTLFPDGDGDSCRYIEEDSESRRTKEIWLDLNNNPSADSEGDYGLSYEYKDNNLTIIRCLGIDGEPHNNQLGYGIIHSYKDINGNEIKKMFFTVEGDPATYPDLLGCYGLCYEYPDENCKITGYLDENGNITTNKYGYSYREEVDNSENGSKRVFFYDINRNNTQSLENDNNEFGYTIANEDEWRYIISLAKDGSITNNACGYAVKYELYENGQLRFYKFQDVNRKPVADNCGDYGTEIQRSDDGSMTRFISLNKNYEKHINDYGYCYCDIITDIAGDQVTIWRDLNGNQVLPKMRLPKRIKSFFYKLKKNEKTLPIFNCRQIGAIFDCVLGNIEVNGLGKKSGLSGTFVLLQFDNWTLRDNNEDLHQIILKATERTKHLVLLPVSLNGSLLKDVGEIIEIDFPKGQIGMRFMEWGINADTIRIILEKTQGLKIKTSLD